ncbi:TEA1 protein, partial [Amia calva]|nr:TEA1 protein [Amia calva]
PRPRWCHAMCLSDPETAVMIGGEATEQTHCTDSLWKLEIDDDFWFPMDCSSSGPIPLCSRGHSATYDPESKTMYVYGGMKDGRRYSDIYILNTLTWKWSHVAARGLVPTLAYHTATIYKKELLVFGGVCPSRTPEGKACSNALFIFNPEYELWYQPIVEGDKPQPRFGHSATLLMNKLLIFGGKKTPTYLNDLCIMDLGYMEYSAVKYANTPPLPRGFHAAVPVSDKKMLISGGCSAIGALQDIFFFNLESSSWSELLCPALCAKPRAGHSMINLVCPRLTDTDKQKQADTSVCTILIFGGSDCTGTFYNDTVRSTVETGEGRTKRL